MTRHSLNDPRVKEVESDLIDLFLALGSVSALTRALSNVGTEGGDDGRIYANRIHTLLSGDPDRGINSETLERLETATKVLVPNLDEISKTDSAQRLRSRVLYASSRLPHATDDAQRAGTISSIAESTQVPPAVVGRLLVEGGVLGSMATAHAAETAQVAPDWGFQDDAYLSALAALRIGAGRKVGLILPTGAGKTRVAVRIAMRVLADSERRDSHVLWVTHRRRLLTQVRTELQRSIKAGTVDLPPESMELLATRFTTCMVSELPAYMEELGDSLALVVVDEAHHAAAPSYAPIIAANDISGLFLTATPNRTDDLPIGIDEIAYTITYRELFARGVIVPPHFETPRTIDWGEEQSLRDLADYVVERAEDLYEKTLIVAARVEYVERFHEFLLDALGEHPGHILSEDQIGFVHGNGSSSGLNPDDFLDEFVSFPRGILVATTQMLGEGFDDATINAVVVTYPTSSMIQLMQAAGRALRSAPGKTSAFVVQARESDLAYHYEQRWLYQDISDELRPQLLDINYSDPETLVDAVKTVCASHNVSDAVVKYVLSAAAEVHVGESFSMMLTGLPYDGAATSFGIEATWGAVAVPPDGRDRFVRLFNRYSILGGEIKDPAQFLQQFLSAGMTAGSTIGRYADLLQAMDYARYDRSSTDYFGRERRYSPIDVGTTWLTYVTFRFEPVVPDALLAFLADAVNKAQIVAEYPSRRLDTASCVKIRLPLGGTWAFLLNDVQVSWLHDERARLLRELAGAAPLETFGVIASWREALPSCPLPLRLIGAFEHFISPAAFEQFCIDLGSH